MSKSNVVEITKEHTKMGQVVNALQSTIRRLGTMFNFGISPDGKRDYNELYGYGKDLSYSDYFGMFKRSAIGNTIVQKVAKACWGEMPEIKSNDKVILEDELKILNRKGLFKKLQRADILNRIGNFSVMLIGLPDGMDLDQPVGKANSFDDVYFNAYNFDGIEILEWDRDPLSSRFGLPELYQLQTTSFGEKQKDINRESIVVHWSRIVHMAEGALDSSVEGCSSLEAPYNKVIDVMKITGGSGEAYFRNARQQRALEADKDAQLVPGSASVDTLKQNIADFDNGWDSTLRLQNMKAHHLPVNMISPRDPFDVCVEEISGVTGIPIRILTGKGGGQLAGSEDRASWNALVSDRRDDECSGYLLRALEIFNEAGLLELPEDAEVDWPPQAALNEKESAEVGEKRANTLNTILTAMSGIAGDELDKRTVLDEFDFEDIKIDESDLEDEDLQDVLPPTIEQDDQEDVDPPSQQTSTD